MFTWICPKCGSEVPPSYTECPNCAAAGNVTEQTPPSAPGPPEVAKPSPRVKAKNQAPMWAMSLVFALGFLALGAGAYFGYGYLTDRKQRAAAQQGAEMPAPPAGAPDKQSVYGKYIEVTGLRLTEDAAQKARIRFTVVNHAGGEIPDLSGTVVLKANTDKPGDPPLGTFTFKLPSLGPYESKDLEAPVETKLRAYELPDWQFLRVEVKLTSP
jgi:hypothetical protein